MALLNKTELDIYPLCLGGNVFGWTADHDNSIQILDTFTTLGGNFIDTADVYSEWNEGNIGGESERIIGHWMKSKKNRSEVIIATKVAKYSKRRGLTPENINAAVDESLERLQSNYIDIYYAHEDDLAVDQEQYLAAFTQLVNSGKVRYIAASNFTAERLLAAAQISKKEGFAEFIALQNQYNLLDRSEYENKMVPALLELGISGLPFYGLARGFLTGKYRKGMDPRSVTSVRASGTSEYQNDRGWKIIDLLDQIALAKSTTISAIALAWLRAQPTISAPIASARTLAQLHEIMPIIELSADEISALAEI
jgi:aryl-alcohol dehydrogenase-like predicted oxidoreductase